MSTLKTDTLVDLAETVSVQVVDLAQATSLSESLLDSADPNKGSALVGRSTQVVDSIAALRLLDKDSASKQAFVTGYYAPLDGGGGHYRLDTSDVVSADNGGTLIIAADGGRWKLVVGDSITLEVFGAKRDGVTDCAAAFTAALATGLEIKITGNTFYIASTITIPSNTTITGVWKKSKIIFGANASRLFDVSGNNVSISGLILDFSGLATGSVAFRLRSDVSSLQRIYIKEIETIAASGFVVDVTHGSNIIVTLQITHSICRLHRGPGIALVRTFAYLLVQQITIDYVGSASRNHTAYALTGNEGSQWLNCDVTGGLVDGTTTSNHGFAFLNCIAVWMTNCMADTVGGVGFFLTSGNTYFYFNKCVASLCGGAGFGLVGGGNLHLTGCVSAGRKGQVYSPAVDTFRMEGGVNSVQFANCHATNSSGNGFGMVGATRVTGVGCRVDNSSAYGIGSSGSNSCLFTGSAFDANPLGNVSLSSANMLVSACQAASGALLSVTGPGSA